MHPRVSMAAILLLVLAGLAPGCRHAPAVADTGASSFTFVQAPPAPPPPQRKAEITLEVPATRDVIVGARPAGRLRYPVYPPDALAQRAGHALVGVELTIDADGRVASVGPSLTTLSTPGPFAPAFRDAVEEAVREWRFQPAEIRHLEMIKDPGGDYLHLTGAEKVEWKLDVQFTFTASGKVLPASAK